MTSSRTTAISMPSPQKIFNPKSIVLAALVGIVVSVAIGNVPNSVETLARAVIISVVLYVLVELYVEHRITNAILIYKNERQRSSGAKMQLVKDSQERDHKESEKAVEEEHIQQEQQQQEETEEVSDENITNNSDNVTRNNTNNIETEVVSVGNNDTSNDDETKVEANVEEENGKANTKPMQEGEEEPEELLCPILQSLMTDPVITEDGFTYERTAIEHWLKDHDTSPKTGKKLKHKNLIPNHIVRGQLQNYREKHNLPPAAPWQPPVSTQDENSNSSSNRNNNNNNNDNNNNNNNIRIEFNNGNHRVILNRQPNNNGSQAQQSNNNNNSNNNRNLISNMLNESQLQILYATTANILDQHPFLIQDLHLIGHNGVPLTMNSASHVIVNNPNLWNQVLPYILNNEEAKAVVLPILNVIERVQGERGNQHHHHHNNNNNNNQRSSTTNNNYRNVHPIFEAVSKDDVRAMQRMLPSTATGHNSWPGIDAWPLNGKTPDGISLLHYACREGKSQCVRYLLTLNINVNEMDRIRSTPLHLASFFGRKDIVKDLLEYNKDGNERCDTNKHMMNGDTALHQAAWNGHIEVMELLMQYKAKPNATKEDGSTPLQLAAIRNQCKSVNFLLKNGAIGTKADVNGNLPMHASAAKGCKHAIQYLSAAAPETINALNNAGEAPIHIATWFGNASNVEAIIACYASTNYHFDRVQETLNALLATEKEGLITYIPNPPGSATYHFKLYRTTDGAPRIDIDKPGSEDMQTVPFGSNIQAAVSMLIRDMQSPRYYGPNRHIHAEMIVDRLMKNIDAGLTTVEKSFLNRSSEYCLFQEENTVARPLKATCAQPAKMDKVLSESKTGTGDVEMNNFTMKKLIEVERRTDGATPLCLAIIRGHVVLVKLFLHQHHANVNICLKNEHETPLHLAAAHNSGAHLQILKLLLHSGNQHREEININAKMKNSFTPLLIAVANNCLNNVELLLRHDAKVDSQSSNGTTALMIAAETGNITCLQILLKHGNISKEIINKQRVDGKSALHLGTISGNVEIVEELINYEADPFLKNVGGVLPIEIAQQMNHNVIAGMLGRYMSQRNS